MIIDLSRPADYQTILSWLTETGVETLNIAGPRESSQPGIYLKTMDFLSNVFNFALQ